MLLLSRFAKPLTEREAIVLRELLTLPRVSRDRLTDQLWGDNPDGGPVNANTELYKIVTTLRPKLFDGFEIDCLPVVGYALQYNKDTRVK